MENFEAIVNKGMASSQLCLHSISEPIEFSWSPATCSEFPRWLCPVLLIGSEN